MEISVVHVVPSLGPEAGGLSQAVLRMSEAAAAYAEMRCWIVAREGGEAVPTGLAGGEIVPIGSAWPGHLRAALQRLQVLAHGCELPTIIHIHGLWRPELHWTVCASQRLRLPFAIQPHGMLEPWALRHKGWKKRLAMGLYQRRDLEAAPLLVATAEAEYRTIREQGFRNPVAIIPLGVDRVEREKAPDLCARRGRRVLFLSRIHPVKGLPDLIRAWARIYSAFPEWELAIAGPDEGRHLAEVLALAKTLGVDKSIHFFGMFRGEEKAAALRSADLFVLPTYSENFGLVVLEALAHGLPVITTRAAPWEDLLKYQCGWWIENGVAPLAAALREAMSLPDEARQAMGERARSCAARYAWEKIAQRMAEAYGWMLGLRARPSFVLLD